MTDLKNTLAARGSVYGEFSNNARAAQKMKDTMREEPGWHRLTFAHRQSLDIICDKISRVLSGDPNYIDNWHDIAGYAKLAEDRCVDPTLTHNFQRGVAHTDGEIEIIPLEDAFDPKSKQR